MDVEKKIRVLQQRIKPLRESIGMTQKKFAEKIEVSRNSLQNYENGITMPSCRTLYKLKEILNIPWDVLLDGESHMDSDICLYERIKNLSEEDKKKLSEIIAVFEK